MCVRLRERERVLKEQREHSSCSDSKWTDKACVSLLCLCVIRIQHAANLHPKSWRVWSIHHCAVSSRLVILFCESFTKHKNKTGFCVIECWTIGFSLSEECDFQAPRRNGIFYTPTHAVFLLELQMYNFALIELMVLVMMVNSMCCVWGGCDDRIQRRIRRRGVCLCRWSRDAAVSGRCRLVLRTTAERSRGIPAHHLLHTGTQKVINAKITQYTWIPMCKHLMS